MALSFRLFAQNAFADEIGGKLAAQRENVFPFHRNAVRLDLRFQMGRQFFRDDTALTLFAKRSMSLYGSGHTVPV